MRSSAAFALRAAHHSVMLFDRFSDRTRFFGSLESAAGVGVPVLTLVPSTDALGAVPFNAPPVESPPLTVPGATSSMSIESWPDIGVSLSSIEASSLSPVAEVSLDFLGPFLIPASDLGMVFLLPGGLPLLRDDGSGDCPSSSLAFDTTALSSLNCCTRDCIALFSAALGRPLFRGGPPSSEAP